MAESENKQAAGEGYTKGKSYPVKVDTHRHKGVVLKQGDKITPKSEGQFNFLKTNGVI